MGFLRAEPPPVTAFPQENMEFQTISSPTSTEILPFYRLKIATHPGKMKATVWPTETGPELPWREHGTMKYEK